MNCIIYPLHFRRIFERGWAARMADSSDARPAAIPVATAVALSSSKKMISGHQFRSEFLRENAENCLTLEAAASSSAARKRFARMSAAWCALADTQDWLDGLISPIPLSIPLLSHEL
jgi:hypothetical protein